jgi:CelD/BcsL family acetyltransferase involved in cellulose biosynthesis
MRVVPIRRVTLPLNIASHNVRGHLLLEDDAADLYRAVAAYWAEHAGAWDLMMLDGLPEDSPQVPSLRDAAASTSLRALAHGVSRPQCFADLPASMEEYLAGRTGKFRKTYHYDLRRNARSGGIDVVEYGGRDALAGLEVLFAIEANTWKARADDKTVRWPLSDRLRAFLADAVQAFASADQAHVLVMTVDGHPAGGLLGLSRQQTMMGLVTYLDDAYRERVTNTALMKRWVEIAIERRLSHIDFHGDTLNIRRWATRSASFRRLYLVNGRPYSRLLGTAKASATWLSRALRGSSWTG